MLGPSLLLNGYRRLFHRAQSGRGVGLTTRLNLVPRLRVWVYISSPPYMPSWRGQEKLQFLCIYIYIMVVGYKQSIFKRQNIWPSI